MKTYWLEHLLNILDCYVPYTQRIWKKSTVLWIDIDMNWRGERYNATEIQVEYLMLVF